MNNVPEERLVDLIRQTRLGESHAYRQLLEGCTPLIRQAARSYLTRFGHQSFTEDIVQEVLLAIHQKLHTYDTEHAFLPWLRSVTRHKTIDLLRKHRTKLTSLDDEDVGEIEDTASQNDATASRDLDVLLKQLKPPAGDIIYLLKVEGASVAELAKKYDLRESNIKVIVHRGLAKLSKMVLDERLGTP